MKTLWIIALCLHLYNDKRLESETETRRFIIQTETKVI